MPKQYKFEITRKEFLDWLFCDQEEIDAWGKIFIKEMQTEYKISRTARQLFKERDSLPGHLFEDQMNEEDMEMGLLDEDIEVSEIKLID